MCRKFGPRCTPSAKASLLAATKRLAAAKTEEQKIRAVEAHLRAEKEYYCTTGGMKFLNSKIKSTGDEDGNYANLLAEAKQSREWRISLSKESEAGMSSDYHIETEDDSGETDAHYSALEENVARALSQGKTFQMNGETFVSMGSGKPNSTRGGGEPKTDVYVLAQSAEGEEVELKISCKKTNADFLENKVSKERFEAIVGDADMQPLLTNAVDTLSSRPTFVSGSTRHPIRDENKEVVGYEDTYLLGYRLDILNKDGKNHVPWQPPHSALMEIYAGENLPDTKKHASVPGINEGDPIKNSGVANMILVGDNFNNAQDIVDTAVPMDEYVKENDTVYFVFKGVNYRSHAGKWDSNRSLGINVIWDKNADGELEGKLDDRLDMFKKDANAVGGELLTFLGKDTK